MSSFPSAERRALLEIAWRAIVLAVKERRRLEIVPPPGILGEPAGAFVTLRRCGQLRGCIGQILPILSLAEVTAHCAMAAALEDPRFPPLEADEFDELEIEISILTLPQEIQSEQITVGKHGLLVTREGRRGLLLPQVATEHRLTKEQFLEETCRKAGLEPSAWKDPATKIEAFTAEVFRELGSRLAVRVEAGGADSYSSST